jgi:MFS family permease
MRVASAPSGNAGAAITRRAQIVDVARSVPLGMILPLESSVLLTIVVKHFHGGPLSKGLVSSAGGIGLLATPFVTSLARRLGWRVQRLSAVIAVVGAVGFAVAALGPLVLFVIGAIVGVAARNSVIPLLTVTYERVFDKVDRGKRVGRGLAMRVAVSAITAFVMGAFLKRHLDRWPVVVLIGLIASLAGAACDAAMPSQPLSSVAGVRNRPWPHFHLLSTDRRLRLTLGAWMLMGFGNLMLLPLRVEYLAQPKYGIEADAAKILLLTVTVPAIVRFVVMPFFGSLFDRLSFFSARIMVNLFFALYVVAFFTGTSNVGLLSGAVVLGVANAGGDLMWTLWVTKFAPPGRVADYMGLHTFFTGIRAFCAPLLAFFIVERVALSTVAWIATGLMLASALVLLPEARAERTAAPDTVAS